MEKAERAATTAERLREAMQAADKRQVDLVQETGLDKGAICSYVAGKYEPKQKAVALLARALGVSEMWLWGYDVPMWRSEEQKKNDRLAKLVAKMRKDPDFLDAVSVMADLKPEQVAVVKQLLAAFQK